MENQLSTEAIHHELAMIQEWFHRSDDGAGNVWRPPQREMTTKKRRFMELLHEFGVPKDEATATTEALAKPTCQDRRPTFALDGEGRAAPLGTRVYPESTLVNEDPADDFGRDKYFPSALVDLGPEAEAERQLLLAMLTDPAPTPHSIHKEDDLLDLENNFLHKLYLAQDKLVGTVIDAPVHPFQSFCGWFFARALIYGFSRIYQFQELLSEAYPSVKPLDPNKVSEALYRDGVLRITDASELDRRVRNISPSVIFLIGHLMQSYADYVNAMRKSLPLSDDLPELHTPDVKKYGMSRYKTRIIATYNRTKSADKTAAAFNADIRSMRNYLKRIGLMTGYVKPVQQAVTTTSGTRRHRRRYR